jgi:pyrroline-5-carboxylate reductase
MTIVELPQDCPSSFTKVIGWIFSQIGQVKVLDADLFDAGTMLMASVASVSVAFDGLLDECVANGLQRADASEMASQCLLGLSLLLKSGMHPTILRENISSPRGCTTQGLLTVEKAAVRCAFAESIINGTKHLQDLQKKDPLA